MRESILFLVAFEEDPAAGLQKLCFGDQAWLTKNIFGRSAVRKGILKLVFFLELDNKYITVCQVCTLNI